MNRGASVPRKLEEDLRRGMDFFFFQGLVYGVFIRFCISVLCCEDSLGLSRAPGGVDKDFLCLGFRVYKGLGFKSV